MSRLKKRVPPKLVAFAFFLFMMLLSLNEYEIVQSFVRIVCRSCIGLD